MKDVRCVGHLYICICQKQEIDSGGMRSAGRVVSMPHLKAPYQGRRVWRVAVL